MNKILNFHLVNDIEWFDKIISLIKRKYNIVSIDTLEQYYNGTIKLKNACHITVDDGDKTFYDIIYPVLKKYKVPASLYVSPKIFKNQTNYWFQEVEGYKVEILKRIIAEQEKVEIQRLAQYDIFTILKSFEISKIHDILKAYRDETNTPLKPYQNMSIEELKEVDEFGLVTIGAHTMNHPILNNETDDSSKYEISSSVEELESLLGHSVKCFSYPNGIPGFDFTEREQNFLKQKNIKLTFSTKAINFRFSDNVFSIPRIGVSNNENMLFLKAKLFLGSFWDYLKKVKSDGEYTQRKKLKEIFHVR